VRTQVLPRGTPTCLELRLEVLGCGTLGWRPGWTRPDGHPARV